MTKIFNKYDKLKMFGLIIKSVTGIVGGSLILTEDHPYITLAVLALGGAANEFVSVLKDKEVKKVTDVQGD
jgi:hypothetical protein